MDSGLGSDEDRRTRTKEQKQLRNQQLLSGCFIDAASLSDDADVVEQRRSDERRQGALIFQSSIPQFSMLQMSGPESGHESSPGPGDDPDTPYNSIVQVDPKQEAVRKSPLGFYVDLSQIEEPAPQFSPPSSTQKKNIFSMVIDFEGPKKGKPAKLTSSTLTLKKLKKHKHLNDSNGSVSLSSSATCINWKDEEAGSSSRDSSIPILGTSLGTQSMINVPMTSNAVNGSSNDESDSPPSSSYVNGGCVLENSEAQVLSEMINEHEVEIEKSSGKVEFLEPCNDKESLTDKEDASSNNTNEQQHFVKLSDLEWQKPRPDISLAPRMSRSIPESSWVESSLLMSRSAGYTSAPHPLEPEPEELSDSITSSVSQPKKSVRRLGTDLLRMFLEEIGPDVTIEVDGRKLKAHKCILASRCQYFAALLSGNWLEASGNVISLHGFSYEAVYFALCHVYSGASHVPDSISLVELASLADMLGLEGLKEVVEHALKQRHCHSFHRPCAGCCTGVLEVLPLAAAYGLDDLYQKCLQWITQHFVKVWPCRAFASLPRELRDKCYQQHVVHMTPDKVLGTAMNCDKILNTLPVIRWAEPVGQLATQLSDACHLYLRQHFAAVLQAPSFAKLDTGPCWDDLPVEDRILAAAKNLSIEQGCRSYARVCRHLDKTWSRPFADFLNKLKVVLEQGLVSQSDRLIRSNAWLRMDSQFRARIKELTPTTEPVSRLPRATPKRTKLSSATGTSSFLSSSDSSRNSSPGMNQSSRSSHSTSLRCSLLLAARAPQAVPPSPLTTRRPVPKPAVTAASPSVARRSTLTQPTQSSSAKSTPSRNVRSMVKNLPSSTKKATDKRVSRVGQQFPAISATNSTTKGMAQVKKTQSTPAVSTKKELERKPLSRCSSPMKNDKSESRNMSPRTTKRQVDSPVKERLPVGTKKSVMTTKKSMASSQSKKSPVVTKKSPVAKQKAKVSNNKQEETEAEEPKPSEPAQVPIMQRSSTFLKDEPTVLNKLH